MLYLLSSMLNTKALSSNWVCRCEYSMYLRGLACLKCTHVVWRVVVRLGRNGFINKICHARAIRHKHAHTRNKVWCFNTLYLYITRTRTRSRAEADTHSTYAMTMMMLKCCAYVVSAAWAHALDWRWMKKKLTEKSTTISYYIHSSTRFCKCVIVRDCVWIFCTRFYCVRYPSRRAYFSLNKINDWRVWLVWYIRTTWTFDLMSN